MSTVSDEIQAYLQANNGQEPEKVRELTTEIKRLEAITPPDSELQIHLTKIRDAYWARRRAWERALNVQITNI